VYDSASFNDRLLLGLKGTMSEAELHVLKARLRGGILNKVRRGEYRCPLPTGFVYNENGNVVFEPDVQVREAIAYFFETFSRVGSASQTVKVFRTEGLVFPSRLRVGDTTVFRPLTASTAMRMLNNPRYAGAYVYGRRQYRGLLMAKGRSRESVNTVIGSLAFRTLIPAISVGSNFNRTSESSRPTVVHMKWHAHRRRGKGPRYCKGAPSAVDVEGTSVSDTPRGEEGRKPGMSAIVATPLVASRTASRSQDRQSTTPLESS
jgi:recombinase